MIVPKVTPPRTDWHYWVHGYTVYHRDDMIRRSSPRPALLAVLPVRWHTGCVGTAKKAPRSLAFGC
eukprot:217511-Rhodomonas_salina.1